ncbi:MAG: LysR family transcriptional regulator [Sneathiella sp.]
MRVLSLQRLEIFRTVYETNNISEAARRLKLAQPTVSRHLRDFEASLKMRLFSNQGGRIKPTWEAHRLFEECSGSFERLRQIESAIEAIRGGRGESLRLMSVPSFLASSILPFAIRTVLEAFPEIDVSIDVGNSTTQIQALRDGNIDIGVASGLGNVPGITVEKIGDDDILMVVARNHPMAGKDEFPLSALETYPCILPSVQAPIGGFIARKLEELGIKPKKLMTAVSPAIVPGLVEELDCCAVLDHLTANAFAHLEIVAIPLSVDLKFEVQAIRNASAADRAVVDLYIQSLKEVLSRKS